MYHFYSNPLSILTAVDPTSSEFDIILKGVTSRHIDESRVITFNSVRRFVESIKDKSPEYVNNLLSQQEFFKQEIKNGLIEIKKFHIKFRIGFKCLIDLQNLYKSSFFKKSKRALYLMSLQGSLYLTDHVQLLIKRSK